MIASLIFGRKSSARELTFKEVQFALMLSLLKLWSLVTHQCWCLTTYYLLTESEVITGKSQTKALMYWLSGRGLYVKTEVWDFPVMTERTRLISYLLYGLFSAILKKNTIKKPEVIFHIRLRALWLSLSLILKKYLYASFSFNYWKYSSSLSIFFVVVAHALVALLKTQQSRWAEKKKFIMPGHCKKIMPA